MSISSKYQILLIVSCLLFLVCYGIIRFAFGEITCDDAFITLCHARNWYDSGCPVMSVYNTVCATSSPLFTLIVSSAGFMKINSLKFVFYFNVLIELFTFFLLFRFCRMVGFSQVLSLFACSLYGLSILTIHVGSSAMETPLYVLLGLWGMYLIYKEPFRVNLLCLCILLITLVRPEGILWGASWVLIVALKGRKLRITALLILTNILALGVFFLFYYLTYGNPFPHSVIAKLNAPSSTITKSIQHWFYNLLHGGPVIGGKRIRYLFTFIFCTICFWGIAKNEKKNITFIPMIIPPSVYFVFMIINGRSHFHFTWYYLPVLPWVYLFLLTGIIHFSLYKLKKIYTYIIVDIFFVCAMIGIFTEQLSKKSRNEYIAREDTYKKISEYIINNYTNSGAILIEEVGAIGWYYNGPILDPTGLVSPEVLKLKKEDLHADYDHYDNLALLFRPIWIVTGNPQGSKQNRFKWIAEHYRLEKIFSRPGHYSDMYLLKLIE